MSGHDNLPPAQSPEPQADPEVEALQRRLGEVPPPGDGARPLASVEWRPAAFHVFSETPVDADLGALQRRLAQELPGPAEPQPAAQPRRLPGRPRKRSALALVVAVCLCLALVGAGALVLRALRPAAPAPAAPSLHGALELRASVAVRASESVPVEVRRADAPNGLTVTLVAQGSYGARVYRAAFAGGVAAFQLPGEDTRQSGVVDLIATAGAARGTASVEVKPGPAASPVTPLVGARSIIADGQHWSMAVAVPFDDYGNPLDDGSPVEFQALHPGQQLEQMRAVVSNLLAWRRIWSRERAGRTVVTASSGAAHGPEATFEEVPGWPASFGLSASPASVPADGRQLVTLRTDVIRDTFGNPMVDGTLVTLVVDMPGGEPRLIPAYTIDGSAEAQLQAPNTPLTVTIRATLYGVESRPLAFTFTAGPAVGDIPVTAHVNARDGVVALAAGPLEGPLGQFVPDGTPVRFRLADATGASRVVDGEAKDGYAHAELRLADLAAGSYAVAVDVGAGHGATTFVVP